MDLWVRNEITEKLLEISIERVFMLFYELLFLLPDISQELSFEQEVIDLLIRKCLFREIQTEQIVFSEFYLE